MRRLAHWLSVLAVPALASCASWRPVEQQRAYLVHGSIVPHEWTLWVLDWCNAGIPAEAETVYGYCFQHGGELQRAYLSGRALHDTSGRMQPRLPVALPGHGYIEGARWWDDFLLLPATADLEAATHLQWVATPVGPVDRRRGCIQNNHWLHFDGGEASCPDAGFHEGEASCIPLGTFLHHYGRH